jgi:hypothetical protein
VVGLGLKPDGPQNILLPTLSSLFPPLSLSVPPSLCNIVEEKRRRDHKTSADHRAKMEMAQAGIDTRLEHSSR